MPDRDVVLAKVASIQKCLERIKEATSLDPETASKMEKMVGFRNIAIHNYQALDLEILKSILSNNLKDLEDFYVAVLRHFGFLDEGKA